MPIEPTFTMIVSPLKKLNHEILRFQFQYLIYNLLLIESNEQKYIIA